MQDEMKEDDFKFFPLPKMVRPETEYVVDDNTKESIIMEPYEYLLQNPGKNVRNLLIDAFQLWLQIPEDKLELIKAIISKLHNASLLIDDIEDGSEVRRGNPVAHSIFGEAAVINCANYVYFQAMNDCRKLENAKALEIFVIEMLNLHRGQGLDIHWRDNLNCPTLEDYQSMVMDKTGGVFRLAIKLMQCFSEDQETDYVSLGNELGLFFQIRDDYINLMSEEFMGNKGVYEDLTEGKFSFPIIHAIRQRPDDRRILNILKQRTNDLTLKQHAVNYIASCGSFKYTFQCLKELQESLVKHINELGGNPPLMKLQQKLYKNLESYSEKEEELAALAGGKK